MGYRLRHISATHISFHKHTVSTPINKALNLLNRLIDLEVNQDRSDEGGIIM